MGASKEEDARPAIVISATNRNLWHKMRAGEFRSDLFYRLNVIPLWVPPLRDSPGLLQPLIQQLLKKANAVHGTNVSFRDMDATAKYFLEYFRGQAEAKLPSGNGRELLNMLERIVCHAESNQVKADEIPALVKEQPVNDLRPWQEDKKGAIGDRKTWLEKVILAIQSLIPEFKDPSSAIKSKTGLLEQAIAQVTREYEVAHWEVLAAGRKRQVSLGTKALWKHLRDHEPSLAARVNRECPRGK